ARREAGGAYAAPAPPPGAPASAAVVGDRAGFLQGNDDLGVGRLVLEHPGAIGVEPEERGQADADEVRRDVVSELVTHVEQIPGHAERDDGDDHAGEIDGDEED